MPTIITYLVNQKLVPICAKTPARLLELEGHLAFPQADSKGNITPKIAVFAVLGGHGDVPTENLPDDDEPFTYRNGTMVIGYRFTPSVDLDDFLRDFQTQLLKLQHAAGSRWT